MKTQFKQYWYIHRSSRPEVFCKKGVPRTFAKFTGKQLCQSLFLNKVAGLRPATRPATLLKKRLWHRCFPVNFTKFLRTSFLTEHLQWLLLYSAILKLHKCKTNVLVKKHKNFKFGNAKCVFQRRISLIQKLSKFQLRLTV